MAENSFEKRSPRLSLDVEVNCVGRGIAHTKNISKTGILLITDTPMVEGNYIQMKFFLPEIDREINAHGKIVRTGMITDNYYESGINFWNIEPEDKEILDHFFESK
ncbi:MAG: PilZ domain-containing protein [Spirochaetales bacterium]|nr:PilZ domain-containing protein [Spirochaetales bacterium]